MQTRSQTRKAAEAAKADATTQTERPWRTCPQLVKVVDESGILDTEEFDPSPVDLDSLWQCEVLRTCGKREVYELPSSAVSQWNFIKEVISGGRNVEISWDDDAMHPDYLVFCEDKVNPRTPYNPYVNRFGDVVRMRRGLARNRLSAV